MPLYEYKCPACGRFELIQKFSDAPLVACPTCGKEVHKLLSAPAIQFKGTGWYITDYARKSSGGDGAAQSSASSSSKEAPASTDKPSSSPASTTSKDGSADGSSPSK